MTQIMESPLTPSENRVLTIDDLSPQRRRTLVLPPGVSQTKLRHRNDKVMPAAKLIVFSTWIDGMFEFGPRGFDRAIAYMFAIEQKLQDEALSLAESLGWIEVDWSGRVVTEINLLETIFDHPSDAGQMRLGLGTASSNLVIEEVYVHLGSLRRLLPRKVMGDPQLHFAHKLLFIAERAESGLTSTVFQFRLTQIGRTLGLDRNSVRAGAKALARFIGETPSSQSGVISFRVPACLYSRTEIELFERVHRLAFSDDDIRGVTERVSSVDGEGVSSTLPLMERASRQHPPLMNGGVRQRSEVATVDEDVVSSTVLPQALTKTPSHQRNRSREAPSMNASAPHNHDHYIDNMICGGEDDEEQARRVLAREQSVLTQAHTIDLTTTQRYMIRAWALMVETDLVKDQHGQSLILQVDDFERILDAASRRRCTGGYLTTSFRDCLKPAATRGIKWREVAATASRQLGLTFGDDMRDAVGGPSPIALAKKSARVRGGDGANPKDMLINSRVAELKLKRVKHSDAVAQAIAEFESTTNDADFS